MKTQRILLRANGERTQLRSTGDRLEARIRTKRLKPFLSDPTQGGTARSMS